MSVALERSLARVRRAAARVAKAGPRRARAPKPATMAEDEIQIEIASRLDAAGILWCHVPNEGRCSAREGGRRKAQGVKAGIPDVMIFDAPPVSGAGSRPVWVGAALELKREDESPSAWKPHQRQWAADLASRGWATAVAFGLEAALAQLRAWGYAV